MSRATSRSAAGRRRRCRPSRTCCSSSTRRGSSSSRSSASRACWTASRPRSRRARCRCSSGCRRSPASTASARPIPASVTSTPLRAAAEGSGLGPIRSSLVGLDGSGVLVALLDTGVDFDSPYLHGHVLTGLDMAGGTVDARPRQGPGGVARAARDGDGRHRRRGRDGPGISGVAPGATVLPIRVGGWQQDASGRYALFARTDQILAGLDRAVDPDGNGDAHDAARIALVPLAEPFGSFADGPLARAAAGASALGHARRDAGRERRPGGSGVREPLRPRRRAGGVDGRGRRSPPADARRPGRRPGRPPRAAESRRSGAGRGRAAPLDVAERRRRPAPVQPRGHEQGRGQRRVARGRRRSEPRRDGRGRRRRVGRASRRHGTPGGRSRPRVGARHPRARRPRGRCSNARSRALSSCSRSARLTRCGGGGRPRIAGFSSWGLGFGGNPKPEVAGPGVGVVTVDPGVAPDHSSHFVVVDGGSAAAAAAAGEAAVVAQATAEPDGRRAQERAHGHGRPPRGRTGRGAGERPARHRCRRRRRGRHRAVDDRVRPCERSRVDGDADGRTPQRVDPLASRLRRHCSA